MEHLFLFKSHQINSDNIYERSIKMITIEGKEIQNYPEGVENLGELMLGEINSNVMHNLKTPQYVYGYSTEEILEFAKKVKEADALYDTVYIYDVEDDGIRDFLHQEEIK